MSANLQQATFLVNVVTAMNRHHLFMNDFWIFVTMDCEPSNKRCVSLLRCNFRIGYTESVLNNKGEPFQALRVGYRLKLTHLDVFFMKREYQEEAVVTRNLTFSFPHCGATLPLERMISVDSVSCPCNSLPFGFFKYPSSHRQYFSYDPAFLNVF